MSCFHFYSLSLVDIWIASPFFNIDVIFLSCNIFYIFFFYHLIVQGAAVLIAFLVSALFHEVCCSSLSVYTSFTIPFFLLHHNGCSTWQFFCILALIILEYLFPLFLFAVIWMWVMKMKIRYKVVSYGWFVIVYMNFRHQLYLRYLQPHIDLRVLTWGTFT